MTRRRAALLLLVTSAWLAAASGAAGVTSVQAGWWTTAPVALAPDAPEDALLVQGGATFDRPLAFAAVAFALAAGETPGSLTLALATGSASTPGADLTLCPLTATFTAAGGGAAKDAPSYDCGRKLTAGASAGGTTYAFDVAGLGTAGGLAVAILPTVPTDRVVLARPAVDALTTSGPGRVDDTDSSASPNPPTATVPAAGGVASPAGRSVPAPPSHADAPSRATSPAPAAAQVTAAPAAASAAASLPIASSGAAKRTALPALAIGSALLAAGLGVSAGSPAATRPDTGEEP